MADEPPKINSASFDEYNTELQNEALKATKASTALTSLLSFHSSLDAELAKDVDASSERVLRLTNRLLEFVNTSSSSSGSGRRGKEVKKLKREEDVVDLFKSVVVDAIDDLFEKADICLDEFLGRSKPAAIAINPLKPATGKGKNVSKENRLDPFLTHAYYLPKPQLRFARKVDNFNEYWRPAVTHKYNAKVPLGYNYQGEGEDDQGSNNSTIPHPYRYEIQHISYPPQMFKPTPDPAPPKSFDDTPFSWVDNAWELKAMIDKLRQAKEIAIDLEHHNYRSFAGFLCLMQISTREEDFIVDTLELRDELFELNEVFTNPDIIKVFHGADSDIIWLQQDFNLYIVNLFDTYHASNTLQFERNGLGALLEHYCNFTADKRYQLADWRIRPLPKDMMYYARADTHSLLYLFDRLRIDLIDKAEGSSDLIHKVCKLSEQVSLNKYERVVYDYENGSGPEGWKAVAKKWKKEFGGSQLAVFRNVHAWRNRVAREEDESTRYVLPNHFLIMLAEKPPTDMPSFISMFRQMPRPVRARADELLQVILDAVKEGAAATSDDVIEVEMTDATSIPLPVSPTTHIPPTDLTTDATLTSSFSHLWTYNAIESR